MSAPGADWIEELSRTVSSRLLAIEHGAAVHDGAAIVARRRRDALNALERSLPSVYRWARFEHPDFRRPPSSSGLPARPPSAARVVFFGPAGAGKTTLAVALLRALVESKIARHAFASDDDVDAVTRQYRFASAHRLAVTRLPAHADPIEISLAMRARVVLLDDLGSDSAIDSSPIQNIIAERHAEERVTWITTGLSPAEIAKRYGGGTARRVLQGAQTFRMERDAAVT